MERPRWIAARMPARCSRSVRRAARTGRSRERDAQASQASRCVGREAGVGEVVEQPQLLAQQEGAVEAAVLGWTSASVASWQIVWFSGAFSSDQRVLLTQRPVGVWRALVGVPFVAADLVGGAAAPSRTTWNGIEADLGVRDRRADRRAGTRRSCRSRPPGSSPCARRARRRTPAGWRCCGPAAHHTIRPVCVVGRRRSGSGDGGDSEISSTVSSFCTSVNGCWVQVAGSG